MASLSHKFRSFNASLQNIYPASESMEISSMVFEDILRLNRISLRLQQDKKLNNEEIVLLDQVLNRLMKHEPVQYVLGYAWFMGHKYLVNEHVLIPRRETEELIEWICQEEAGKIKTLADLGTGSGCIAIELNKRLDLKKVTAIDISPEALHIARINSTEILGKENACDFLEMDILMPNETRVIEKYDLLVSNPPYISHEEKHHMRQNVLNFEPGSALFAEKSNPLSFYQAILELSPLWLKSGGRLYLEINEYQVASLRLLLKKHGFRNIKVKQDMQRKDRMMQAVLG